MEDQAKGIDKVEELRGKLMRGESLTDQDDKELLGQVFDAAFSPGVLFANGPTGHDDKITKKKITTTTTTTFEINPQDP